MINAGWLFVAAIIAGIIGVFSGVSAGYRDGLAEGRSAVGSELCAKQGARYLDGKCMRVEEVGK